MVLTEWDTDVKQQQLLEILNKEGSDAPNNLIVNNAVLFSIEKRFPVTRMRFFSTKYDENTSPTYVFVVEDNDNGMSSIFARPPTHKHERSLLEKALTELFDMFHTNLRNHGEMRVRSDTFTRDLLADLALTAQFDIIQCATTAAFYLNEMQIKYAKMLDWPPVEGFHVDVVDLEKDAQRIHENYEHSESLEATKDLLRYLPSTIVRETATGEAVCWTLTSPFGQAIAQYTLPAFRGRGLARMTEANQGISGAKQGLRPFYLAQIQNAAVFAGAKNDPYVSMWEEKVDNNNEEGGAVRKQDRRHFPIQNTIIRMK